VEQGFDAGVPVLSFGASALHCLSSSNTPAGVSRRDAVVQDLAVATKPGGDVNSLCARNHDVYIIVDVKSTETCRDNFGRRRLDYRGMVFAFDDFVVN
jgi:hypothetical protein